MKKTIKKLLALALCALTLLTLTTSLVSAEEGAYVDFTVSMDESTIYADGVEYHLYDLPHAMFLMPQEFYYYLDMITIFEKECYIRADRFGSEVIFVHPDKDSYRVYATDTGRTYLDELLLERKHIGEYLVYTDMGYYAEVNADFVAGIEALKDSPDTVRKAVSGATLSDCEFSDLGAKDVSDAYMARYGLIYTLTDGYYYLDRSMYDTVLSFPEIHNATAPFELLKLSDEQAKEYLDARKSGRYYSPTYVYEGEEEAEAEDGWFFNFLEEDLSKGVVAAFFVVLALVGFLLPLAGVIVACVLMLRSGNKRQWLLLIGICGVWILIALLLLILLVTLL